MNAQKNLTIKVTENYKKLRKTCFSMVQNALEQSNIKEEKAKEVIINFIK